MKKIILFLLNFSLIFASSAKGVERDYELIKNLAKLPILSPAYSKRKTEKIRLKNGLVAYLISDPNALVSGAMLSVKAGSWQDPIEHPGLAHYLEHMLFLGTKEYPEESEYEKFIAEHGGMTNAFTASNQTSYLFTVNNKAFPEALSRFSSFFKEPLFNPSGVARELNAINQEYAKNIEQDSFRELYVLKELADLNHPFHNFNMGHSQSLAHAKRENLENWFQGHYSANLMRLVLYSKLPLEEMAMLVSQNFSEISNKQKSPLAITAPAFAHQEEANFVYIEPIKDARKLMLVWELPTKFSHRQQTRPEEIVSFILGHEGEKSLLAQLKREHLVETLAAGGIKLGDDLTLYYLQFELTDEGIRDVEQVITRSHQAINYLKKVHVPSYIFDEIQKMDTIEYQYQSRNSEFATLFEHAQKIHDEEIATYPEHTEVIQQFNPTHVKELLEELTPERALYLVVAPAKLTGVATPLKEKWLDVHYGIKPIPKDRLDKWKKVRPHPEITLPAPNIFIPDDLQLVSEWTEDQQESILPKPSKLVDSDKMRVYFAKDSKYGVPKVTWIISVLTPQISLNDPQKIALADLYLKDLKESLSRISYPAELAGLHYDVKREKNGIQIVIYGYSQNATRLLEEIIEAIKNYQPAFANFKLIKASNMRKYKNFTKESPLQQSVDLFKSVLHEYYVTDSEKAGALRQVSFKKYSEFVASLFEKTYIQAMLYGNMTASGAIQMSQFLDNTFDKGAYEPENHLKNGVLILPEDQGPYYLECRTKSQGNACLLAIENIPFSFKKLAVQQILMQAVKEPFFAELRTKQQTGYLVQSVAEEVERTLFDLFAVQSNSHDVRDLLSRFEAFIESYVHEMGKTELGIPQFENIKASFIEKYREPAKNMLKTAELLYTLGFDYDGDFEWFEKALAALEELDYQECIPLARSFLDRKNKRRLAILFKGEIPQDDTLSYTRARTLKAVRKMSEYQYR